MGAFMKLDHDKFFNLCRAQSSATVSDLEILEVPDVPMIQSVQQRDLQPSDDNDDPLAIMW
jgi:hypothetical protein